MKLTLIRKVPQIADITTFELEPEKPVTWEAGQFMHYKLPHPNADDRAVKRWFTISSAPFEQHLAITTRHAAEKGSTFKEALFALKPGDTIEADGPEGDFTVEDPSKHLVFIAGGIGITPFHSIILQLDHDNVDMQIELLYSNRTDEYAFMEEFNSIANRRKRLCLHKFTGDRKIEKEDLEGCHKNDPAAIFYVSGPEPMVENYKAILDGLGLPETQIKADYFPGYL